MALIPIPTNSNTSSEYIQFPSLMHYLDLQNNLVTKDMQVCLDNSEDYFFQAMKGLSQILKEKLCKDIFDCVGEEDLNDFHDSDVAIEFQVKGYSALNSELKRIHYSSLSKARAWLSGEQKSQIDPSIQLSPIGTGSTSEDKKEDFILAVTYSDLYRLDNQGRIVFNFKDTEIVQSDAGCRIVFQSRFLMRYYLHMIYQPESKLESGSESSRLFYIGFKPISSSDFGSVNFAVQCLIVLILLACGVLAIYIAYKGWKLRQEERRVEQLEEYSGISN